MAIDVETPDSPGWWLDKLWKKLDKRRQGYQDLFDRHNGDAPIPRSLDSAPEAAKAFYTTSRSLFAEMIVKAVAYPLELQSVSTQVEHGADGDPVAWKIFRESGMEEEADPAHKTAFVSGRSFAIVSRHRGRPRYTSEDPREVVTIQDPVVQSETVAAMKITHDEIRERDYCWLYLPGRVYRCSKPSSGTDRAPVFTPGSFDWDVDVDFDGENGAPLPGLEDEVPVIPYRNEEGVGEFERHIALLDRIDHMVLQGMVIATYQAFKQRGIKADPEEMPDVDPETGEAIDYDDIFSADPGALWRLPQSAEMWESGAVDLTPVWTGIDRDIQKLSAVTFTPLSMFSPEGQNQSAEGATLTREGRTFKIENRQKLFGRSHEKALSMLLRLAGEEERSELSGIRFKWKPAERHSLAVRASAMSQTNGDIPFKYRAIHIWQASPAEAEEMERQREQEMLMAEALTFTPEQPAVTEDTEDSDDG